MKSNMINLFCLLGGLMLGIRLSIHSIESYPISFLHYYISTEHGH